MEAESKPFIEHLQLQKLNDFFPTHLPFLAYRGIYQDTTEVTLITNGKDSVHNTESCNVGTVAAATISMMTLQSYQPDIYINAGTAGGFQRNGASIGDIYIVSSFTYHDRRIPIPGYDIYGTGKLSASINVNAILDTYNTWKTGICTTGDSLDKTNECDTIMLQSNATVKDMEAAAIAWVSELYKIKFGSIKVITDIVDGTQPTYDEFLANLHTASEQLQHALPLLLDYISSKEIEEL
jgi:5'-methylthioadenosine nucleosidase